MSITSLSSSKSFDIKPPVEIDQDNTLIVDDVPVDISDIQQVLDDKIALEDKNELVVEAHEQSLHDTLIKVFDAAHEVGMQQIRQVVRTE